MAEQRLYLPSSGTATITVAFATWTVTTSAVSWYGSTASHGGTVLTTVSATEVTANNTNQLLRQYIFRNVFAATGNITGTVKGQIRCADVATALPGSQMNIRVVNNDGTVTRGTVYAFENATATVVWSATGGRNAKFPKGWTATAGDAVATIGIVATSDLLVVEVGPRVGVGGESNTWMRFGNPGATASDLTEDETSTVDNRPWIAMLASIFATTTSTATATGAFQGTYTKMMMGVGLGMGSLAVLPHVPGPFGDRKVA